MVAESKFNIIKGKSDVVPLVIILDYDKIII